MVGAGAVQDRCRGGAGRCQPIGQLALGLPSGGRQLVVGSPAADTCTGRGYRPQIPAERPGRKFPDRGQLAG